MQSLNRTISRLRVVLLLLVCISGAGRPYLIHAQLETLKYLDYLQQIKSTTNNPVLAYTYKVVLQDTKTRKILDSTTGYVFKSGEAYLDSNRFMISLVNGGYFFKGNFTRKEAYVYNLSAVERRLGLKREDMTNTLLTVPDSMILKMGHLSAEEQGESILLKYTLKEGVSSIKEIRFRLRRVDKLLQEIRVWVPGAGTDTYYYLTGFTNVFDFPRLQTNRYFGIEKGKAKLKGKYHSYQLTELL